MRFHIEKERLQDLIKKAFPIIERKTAIPILSNFLIEAKNSQIYIESTDLNIHLRIYTPAYVEEEGRICVSAKRLFEISKYLPEDKIGIEQEDKKLKIISGKTKYHLPVIDPNDFPTIPEFPVEPDIFISGEELRKGLEKTSYAVSKEESRYAIQGVLIDPLKKEDKNIINFVATDGHRLALYIASQVDISKNVNNDLKAVIPEKAINELRKLITGFEDVEMLISNKNIYMRSPEFTMTTRILEGEFPEYKKVFPAKENIKIRVKLGKNDFLEAVKRVSAVIEDGPKPVKFILNDNKLTLRSFSQEYGEAIDELDIDYQGDEFKIVINAKYIVDAISPIDEDIIVLAFTHENGQTLIRPLEDKQYRAIVMPMDPNMIPD